MADGNLGNLWMSLGLKETVTKDLKKLQQEFSGTDEKAKKAQETIKEINAALKKPTDTNAISGAFSKLATLLEKSKTDAKDLAVVLKSLNAKDVLSIFNGKITATNAKSYLDMINKIREAINGLGRTPGENTFKLFGELGKAADYLNTIVRIKDNIKAASDFQNSLSKNSGFIGVFDSIGTNLKRIRREVISAFNDGTWKGKSEELLEKYRKEQDFFLNKVNYLRNISVESQAKVAESASNTTESLKKEEEQAKKTAEAVASIGEKKKYVAPNVQIQEKPVSTEVEKTANTATKKLDEVKEKSDKAKSSVIALRTELNVILNAFRGKASKTLGVDNAGKGGRQYIDILNQINKKKEELYNKKGGGKDAAKIDSMVRTAQNYILLLKDIDREYEKISNMKSINPNVDDKNIKEALGLIEHFRQQLTSLEEFQFKTGVDNANVLGNYKSFWGDTRKDANKLAKGLDNTNMLSDLQNKADRANARLAETNRQIERLDRAIDRGKAKGFNTDELFTNRAALLNRKAEFERALGKDTKRLSDVNYMAGLYSETARDIKLATVALEHFGNVQRKVAEQEKAVSDTRKARQSVNKEILNDLDRQAKEEMGYQARQQKIADLQEKANEKRIKQANDVTLAETRQRKIIADLDSRISNATSLYKSGSNAGARTTDIRAIIDELNRAKSAIQGYSGKSLLSFDYKNAVASLDELKVRFNNVAKAQSSMNREAEANHKQMDANVKRMSELYTNLNKQIAEAEKHEFRGMELNVDISKLDKAVADARELAEMINNVNPKLMGKGGNASLEDYVELAKNIKTALDTAVKSQKELNVEQEKANKNKAAEQAKAEAQAKRDAAKATREANAVEKQRQNEIEISKRRIQSMESALAKLQEKRFTPKMLGLDTSEADAKIERLKNQLIGLRNFQLGLSMGDNSFLGRMGNIGNSREVQAVNNLSRSFDGTYKQIERGIELFEKANSHAGKLNSTVQDLKSLFLQGGLVFGAQQFAMSIITTGGEMEKQHIALQSILGDMQNANTLFGQIKELALNSPFTFSELNRDVKQLAAYGVEYDKLYDTTKRLADMASGLGVSFDRIALAFGQVQARGWLDGKELRQIAYAGIPLLSKLSELYSKREGQKVSTSEIKTRISKREVSFDDVKSVFWEMTDAGGQFYNMQQTLSETLLGRYNKLKDAWEIMLAEFASGKSVVGGFFKTALDGATALVQALHTLAMPVTTIFAGYALKKALGANSGSSFLANKGKMATDIQARVLQGEQISQIERQILVTKNRITNADLEQLANARVLTAMELNRLRIAGRITAEQYNTGRALLLQQGAIHSNRMSLLRQLVTIRASLRNLKNGPNFSSIWSSFATSGMATFRLLGTGIKALGATMWSAIGGLPGLLISVATFGLTYLYSKHQELLQKIEQSQEELADKNKQIFEFRRDNNISVTIAKGDEKEIDNMIESYKNKLKELAPYSYRNIYMTAEEEESHKERLRYLDEEIKRLKKANDIASNRLNDSDSYSDLLKKVKSAKSVLENLQKVRNAAMALNATDEDKRKYTQSLYLYNGGKDGSFEFSPIVNIKEIIQDEFGDISKDATLRQAAMQAMSAIFSSLGVPQDQAEIIRASVLQAFGIGKESDWLKEEVGDEMRNLIDTTFPLIAAKIKASRPLEEAEKAKVINLMNDAKRNLTLKYPEVEETIQKLLAASEFKAVIKLVVEDNGFNDVQKELTGRIPSVIGDKKLQEKYKKRTEEYGKDNDWYAARNLAKDNINKDYKNWQSALKSKSSQAGKLKEEYDEERRIAKQLLNYDYDGEGKKSNKTPKDKELDTLKDRIELYKKLYKVVKEYQDLYGKGALEQASKDGEFESIFKDKKNFPISDYTDYKKSIEEMLHGFNANTDDRRNFVNGEHIGIQEEQRRKLAESRKDDLEALEDQLRVIESQYEVYDKIYKLTGNKAGAENIAFGGTVAADSMKKYLESELNVAVAGDNIDSGLNYTSEQVKEMSLKDVKANYGEESRTYHIREKLGEENNKINEKTIDLLADVIQKNATIAQQIEDENREYEYQLGLIEQNVKDPEMKKRAKEGLEKSHNEKNAKLQFEQFKQESDWVTIFDDLNRVSTTTIDTMADKIEDFSTKAGLSVEVVKQLREALNKLRDEQTKRNPLPQMFGGAHEGNAIGKFIEANFKEGDAPTKTVHIDEAKAKELGIGNKGGDFTKTQLENKQASAYSKSTKAITAFANKVNAVVGVLQPVVDLLKAVGSEDSLLGKITGGASNAVNAAAGMAGNLDTLSEAKGMEFLKGAGPYGAAIAGGLSVASSVISSFGADYSAYNKAKVRYENLTSIWDELISKKREYMNIHWGTEAANAAKEAKEMLDAEIEITKSTAKSRLSSGKSAGSHSIGYRIWNKYGDNSKKSPNNPLSSLKWKDVAPEISQKYGVKFENASDFLDMSPEVLNEIRKNYSGLWANLDSDFREYLKKIISYGEQAKEMAEDDVEKRTGLRFTDMVESFGEALTEMSVSADKFSDDMGNSLKKAILKGMVENLYKDRIQGIVDLADKYSKNDEKGIEGSEYSKREWDEITNERERLAKDMKARQELYADYYGWSDNSDSSTNTVKGITEEQADILLSYINAMRLDLSVVRAEQAKYFPEMSEIAKSQLTQLNFIAQNTLRNADSAAHIENLLNSVINGQNKIRIS